MVARIKMKLGVQVGLGPGHIVLDGDPAGCIKMVHGGRPQPPAPSKKGAELPPQFSAHFYCVQTAGCIRMPLGMELGLSSGDFVFDGDPATP